MRAPSVSSNLAAVAVVEEKDVFQQRTDDLLWYVRRPGLTDGRTDGQTVEATGALPAIMQECYMGIHKMLNTQIAHNLLAQYALMECAFRSYCEISCNIMQTL